MNDKPETRVRLDTIELALEWTLKALVAFLVLVTVVGIGSWVSLQLPFPGWVPYWIQEIAVPWVVLNLYLLWRWNGGKVRLEGGDLVIQWPTKSQDSDSSEST